MYLYYITDINTVLAVYLYYITDILTVYLYYITDILTEYLYYITYRWGGRAWVRIVLLHPAGSQCGITPPLCTESGRASPKGKELKKGMAQFLNLEPEQ